MIVYVLFLIILFLILLYEINNRQFDIMKTGFYNIFKTKINNEHFISNSKNTGTINMLIQVDDEFKVFFRGSNVYNGSGWNRAHNIAVQDVSGGDKIYFRCHNGGGPGGIIGKFIFNGKEYYSSKENIIFTGRVIDSNGSTSGSKYMGCYNDRWERDLTKGYGYGFNNQRKSYCPRC